MKIIKNYKQVDESFLNNQNIEFSFLIKNQTE